MNLKAILLFSFLILNFLPSMGQNLQGVDPSTVIVDDLSDEEIKKIMTEIQERGLSVEQATTLAKAKGMTQVQINQLMERIQEIEQSGFSTVGEEQVEDGLEEEEEPETIFSTREDFFPPENMLEIYGFKLFNADNLTFEPSVNIPTPKDYVLGIGDEIMINVWGASQMTYQLRIENNGAIQIPDLGPVFLVGKGIESARQILKNRLISIYSGIGGDQPNTWLDVTLNSYHAIKVNVIGEAIAPGTYSLPATATAFNALYLSGGPNEHGSFRDIRVIRNGKLIRNIDVYDFLINADASENVQLQDQDILFIPTYEARVLVDGEFKRTGMFEMKKGETLSDLIQFAGGFDLKAYSRNVSVERNTSRELRYIDVSENEFSSFPLQNGDEIVAGELITRYENRITIEGAVYRSGTYELKNGMLLSELIEKAEGVREDAFLNRGLITRFKKDGNWETISFNISDVLSGSGDIQLQREDAVSIRSIYDMREEQNIMVYGEVLNPGEYPYTQKMTLEDIIFQSGGFKENADIQTIEISRRLSYDEAAVVSNNLTHIFTFPVSRNLKLNESDSKFELNPYDHIYIRRAPGSRDQGTVDILGEVIYQGTYSISTKKERISDLIKRSGGLTPDAYPSGAILTRKVYLSEEEVKAREELAKLDTTLQDVEIEKEQDIIVGINLQEILKKPGSGQDLLLQPGDKLNIPQKLETVSVSGNVMNPVALAFEKGRSLKKYVESSGGFAPRSKKSKVYVIYPNGITASTKTGFLGRRYPKIEPGCEIIVPSKPEKDRASATQWIGVASALSSLGLTVVAFLRL